MSLTLVVVVLLLLALPLEAFKTIKLSSAQKSAFASKLGGGTGSKTICQLTPVVGLGLNTTAPLPMDYNSHKEFPECAPIRIDDQAACGSCWAFSTSTALSQRMCRASLNISSNFRVSPQVLVTCDRTCKSSSCQAGCSGGYVDLAFQFMKNSGETVENCVPYASGGGSDPYSGNCSLIQSKIDICELSNENDTTTFHAGDCYYHSSTSAMQHDIMQYGPIVATFNVYDDFFGYSSGVYSCPSSGTLVGGHAVVLVGWGVDNGVNYWIAQNSWTSSWGEGGYFRILRGTDTCGIEGFVVTVKPVTGGVTFSSLAYNSAFHFSASWVLLLLSACAVFLLLV